MAVSPAALGAGPEEPLGVALGPHPAVGGAGPAWEPSLREAERVLCGRGAAGEEPLHVVLGDRLTRSMRSVAVAAGAASPAVDAAACAANERLLGLVQRLLAAVGPSGRGPGDAALDRLVRDIDVNPTLALPRQFREMGLWKRIVRINNSAVDRFEAFEEGESPTASAAAAGAAAGEASAADGAGERTAGALASTFRDMYVDAMTKAHAPDFEALREAPSFEEEDVSLLITFLESGVDMWSPEEQRLWLVGESGAAATAPAHIPQ